MTARTLRRRYRPSLPPKPQPRPAPAPDIFDWRPDEIVIGSGKPKCDDVIARITALYGPGKQDEAAE
jgi:hypothetical protein